MPAAESAARERASKQLVAMMSLETMFPDSEVRALAAAAGKGKIEEINKLVEQGVDVNARGARNATPLFWAMRNLDGFTRLLELGADPNVVFDDGGSVMHWAVKHKNDAFLKAALAHGGNPNLVGGMLGETPLFEAMSYGTKRNAPILLDAGANMNAQLKNGNTPMMTAAALGQFDLVLDLLNRGADYTVKNFNGDDLADRIAFVRRTMDPHNELTDWMNKVIDWLKERGVSIPQYKQ